MIAYSVFIFRLFVQGLLAKIFYAHNWHVLVSKVVVVTFILMFRVKVWSCLYSCFSRNKYY